MKVNIYLPHTFNPSYDCDFIVGVDCGAFMLAKKDIQMDVAIGDFDSINEKELALVKKMSKKQVKLSIIKNETDSEAAILYVLSLGYKDITLIGDVGLRLDHLLVNYRLTEKYNVTYLLENSKIFNFKKGHHRIKKEFQFLSLFTNDEAIVTLSGTKYELDNQKIAYYDTYTSANEIIDDFAQIEVVSGNVTVVLSSDQ
ncbi:MAG: thiamine diphosphokinase [Erysipelothrix sp.]|nr:thiamine diphosphokinase [Erysipelothrix sp.]